MFSKILVPVDFSLKNEASLKVALDLAKPRAEPAIGTLNYRIAIVANCPVLLVK